MKATLITAIDAGPSKVPPGEIVYLPEGSHRITPGSHPKGVFIQVPPDQGNAIAAKLQAELERLNAQPVKPFLDFEHRRQAPASGHPLSFRYQPGKGIMLAVQWSGSGQRALQDNDVSYFSPEVYIDDAGIPKGLPERGPIGGLVCSPAFRSMERIAASDGDGFAKECAGRLIAGEEVSNREMESLVAAMEADPSLYDDYVASMGGGVSPSRQHAPQPLSATEVLQVEVDAMRLISGGMTAAEEEAFTERVLEDPAVASAYDRVRCRHYSLPANRVAAAHGVTVPGLEAGMRRLVAGSASAAEKEILLRAMEESSEAYGLYLQAMAAA